MERQTEEVIQKKDNEKKTNR